MAQVLTAKLISGDSAEQGNESYEIIWTIPDWLLKRESEILVNSQEALFETGSSPSAWFKTRWLVGLKVVPNQKNTDCKRVGLYWKLLGITGPQDITLEATLQTQLWNYTTARPTPTLSYTDVKNEKVGLLETVMETETNKCLQFNPDPDSSDEEDLEDVKMIMYKLKLTLKTPEMSVLEYDSYRMEQFSKKSVQQALQNHAALLTDHSETADLKFLTSDQVEIWAHKATLKAQCPVFAAMLSCDLFEKATGIIRMTDITGKTMKILLNYFYTGSLLPSWRDPGTIVEFTYAAGKYQMAAVLELLDDMLGRYSGGDASNLDVQLINLAGKLKLEKAEGRLLGRIVAKIRKVGTGGELFELFGYDKEEVSVLAETLATEQVGESGIMGIMDFFVW